MYIVWPGEVRKDPFIKEMSMEVSLDDGVLRSKGCIFEEDQKVMFERTKGKYEAGLEGRVEGCVPARGELHEPRKHLLRQARTVTLSRGDYAKERFSGKKLYEPGFSRNTTRRMRYQFWSPGLARGSRSLAMQT